MGTFKKAVLLFGDIIVLYASLVGMLLVRYQTTNEFNKIWNDHVGPFSVIFVLWLLIFYWNDLYRYKAFRDHLWLLRALLRSVLIAVIASMVVFYLLPALFELTPKTNLLIFGVIFFVISYLWRTRVLAALVSGGTNVIVLGNSPLLENTVQHLKENPAYGFRVTEWNTSADAHTMEHLEDAIRHTNSHLIVVERHFTDNPQVLTSLYRLIPLEVSIMRFSDFYEIVFEKEPLGELEEEWFIQNVSRRPLYDTMKRVADVFLSLFIGIILFIPSILIGLFVLFSSRGPAIYKQTRIGKNGIHFTLYKFRTMKIDAEKDGPQWSQKGDPRTTPIGRVLRYTHLDEIPQLWNIFCGHISFVGPRPERPEFVATLSRDIPFYEMRHIIRPGLTGWAQVSYKYGSSVEDAKEKLQYDIYYLKHRSIMVDFVTLLRTVKMFLFQA